MRTMRSEQAEVKEMKWAWMPTMVVRLEQKGMQSERNGSHLVAKVTQGLLEMRKLSEKPGIQAQQETELPQKGLLVIVKLETA